MHAIKSIDTARPQNAACQDWLAGLVETMEWVASTRHNAADPALTSLLMDQLVRRHSRRPRSYSPASCSRGLLPLSRPRSRASSRPI